MIGYDASRAQKRTMEIYETIYEIADRAKRAMTPTSRVADLMAQEKLGKAAR